VTKQEKVVLEKLIGTTLSGRVIKVAHFGVFVDLGLKWNGLVLVPHKENAASITIDSCPKIGTEVKAKVLAIAYNEDGEVYYISLDMRK